MRIGDNGETCGKSNLGRKIEIVGFYYKQMAAEQLFIPPSKSFSYIEGENTTASTGGTSRPPSASPHRGEV
tara:strand:+ start:144 stop:356 length:213 start_codon:yes stop_codon:yes gene_type:complete